MRGLLIRLYPQCWREEYGDGFAALLDQTPLSVAVVFDCLRGAATAQVRAHRLSAALVAATIWFFVSDIVALRTGVTANLFWAPTSVGRGVALLMSVVPAAALIASARLSVATR